MNITITKFHLMIHDVHIDGRGRIGMFRWTGNVWKFNYTDKEWTKLTYSENTALLEAIKTPLALLNVTARLLGKP